MVIGGLLVVGCLALLAFATLDRWSDNERKGGEVSQEKETGLPNPMDTAEAFVHAKTIPEKLALLSSPDDIGAARAHFEFKGAEESKVESLRSLGMGRSSILSFHVSSVRFSNGRTRMIYVLTDPETGDLSVDWHSYAETTSVPWRDLLRGEANESDVRVYVERGDYYNFAFEDVDRYQCYKLTTDAIEEVLYGYVDLHSPRKGLIEELLGAERIQRMALRLRRPIETAEPTQFLIEEVLANEWVVQPSSSLEGFRNHLGD